LSSGAVRKCSSMAWKPASMARKFSGPMAIMSDRPNGGIVRVATADPVPELELVGCVDAELRHFLGIGRHRDEVLGDRLFIAERLEQPRARRCERWSASPAS
jgi:hypothetical protein